MVVEAQAVFVGAYPQGAVGILFDGIDILHGRSSDMQSHVAETIGTLVIQEEAVQIGAQPNALLAILEDGQHGIGRQLGRGVMTVDLAVGVQAVNAVAIGTYPHPVPAVFKNTQHALGTDIQLGVEKVETPVVKDALLLGYHHDTFLI